MEIGKLSNSDLEKFVFQSLKYRRREVLLKSSVGMDTSVMDFGGDLLVVSCDPITGATKGIGKLAVNVSCNDVACACAEPVGILMSILLPPTATLEELQQLMEEANEECERLGIDIIGGHTEVTDVVNQIVVTTTVIGRVNSSQLPRVKEVTVGDVIAVSKHIAVEGTAIIATEREKDIQTLSEDEKKEAKQFSYCLSVLEEAKLAKQYRVKHMHDVTEGGIYGALWETAKAIQHGMEIQQSSIPLHPITKKLAEEFHFNPYRLIGSGSMIFVFAPEDFSSFKKECEDKGIKVTKIATVIEENNVLLREDKTINVLEEPGPDELYRVI